MLIVRCRDNTAPEYLARDLHWVTDDNTVGAPAIRNDTQAWYLGQDSVPS